MSPRILSPYSSQSKSLLTSHLVRLRTSSIPRTMGSALKITSSPSPSTQCQPLRSLADISSLYKTLLLDQFGVMHDGTKPYPGAIQAVKDLQERGFDMLIISNSSRRKKNTPLNPFSPSRYIHNRAQMHSLRSSLQQYQLSNV